MRGLKTRFGVAGFSQAQFAHGRFLRGVSALSKRDGAGGADRRVQTSEIIEARNPRVKGCLKVFSVLFEA